jgi:hypothetical protein
LPIISKQWDQKTPRCKWRWGGVQIAALSQKG